MTSVSVRFGFWKISKFRFRFGSVFEISVRFFGFSVNRATPNQNVTTGPSERAAKLKFSPFCCYVCPLSVAQQHIPLALENAFPWKLRMWKTLSEGYSCKNKELLLCRFSLEVELSFFRYCDIKMKNSFEGFRKLWLTDAFKVFSHWIFLKLFPWWIIKIPSSTRLLWNLYARLRLKKVN